MKNIKQLSSELKISKEAVYKKIKYQLKEELTGHVFKLDNVTHVDDMGEQIIIQSLSSERQEAIRNIIESENGLNNEPGYDKPDMAEYINLLQEQLKTKDGQLESQNDHISRLIDQLGGNKYLLQAEQYKSLLYLQANATVGETTQYKPSPFWKRMFKNYLK